MEQEKQQKEVNESTKIGKIKKLITGAFRPINETLTAEKVNSMSNCRIDALNSTYVTTKIKELLSEIRLKTETNPEEKMICTYVPKNQENLYGNIKNYFSELGYSTFYVDGSKVPEMKKNIYLFISWNLN